MSLSRPSTLSLLPPRSCFPSTPVIPRLFLSSSASLFPPLGSALRLNPEVLCCVLRWLYPICQWRSRGDGGRNTLRWRTAAANRPAGEQLDPLTSNRTRAIQLALPPPSFLFLRRTTAAEKFPALRSPLGVGSWRYRKSAAQSTLKQSPRLLVLDSKPSGAPTLFQTGRVLEGQ